MSLPIPGGKFEILWFFWEWNDQHGTGRVVDDMLRDGAGDEVLDAIPAVG